MKPAEPLGPTVALVTQQWRVRLGAVLRGGDGWGAQLAALGNAMNGRRGFKGGSKFMKGGLQQSFCGGSCSLLALLFAACVPVGTTSEGSEESDTAEESGRLSGTAVDKWATDLGGSKVAFDLTGTSSLQAYITEDGKTWKPLPAQRKKSGSFCGDRRVMP